MAGVTGLEPAASGVTGRRSNQLSYTPYRAVVHGRRRSSACTASDSPSQGEARDARLPWSPRQNWHPPTEQCDEADPREAGWWAVTVSNCRPPGCKPGALPAELTALIRYFLAFRYPHFQLLGNTWGNIMHISLRRESNTTLQRGGREPLRACIRTPSCTRTLAVGELVSTQS